MNNLCGFLCICMNCKALEQPKKVNIHQYIIMNGQKKYDILRELDQAIRKKTHEHSRSKEKNQTFQHPTKRKLTKMTGQTQIVSKKTNQGNTQKKNSIAEFKVIKQQNKKFDKMVTLISYTLNSADKAFKCIDISNFQAEFAYKLYTSDRENLLNQLNHFSLLEVAEEVMSEKSKKLKNLIIEPQKIEQKYVEVPIKIDNPNKQLKSIEFYQEQCLKLREDFHHKLNYYKSQLSKLQSIYLQFSKQIFNHKQSTNPLKSIILQSRKQYEIYKMESIRVIQQVFPHKKPKLILAV